MISVVIPLYNKAQSIGRTLSSVLRQTYNDFEIVIVDDGSTDDSVKEIKRYADSRIHIIQQQNSGVCSARNAGIEAAKGEYIALLDADDIWYPAYLEKQMQMVKDFPNAAMWGVNWIEINEAEKYKLPTGLSDGYRGYVTNYFGFKHVSDLFWTSTVVIKKLTFNTVGYFDTRIRYSEDLDMWYRIILNYPVAFSDECLAEYRLDSENRAMNRLVRLTHFLPYYVNKYDAYCENDPVFSKFIHTFTASKLSHYYFDTKEEFVEAKETIKKLRFRDIHKKYSYWYKTPYPVGWLFYQLTKLKHKLL